MPIGPSCAIADVQADHATIWSNTQNVYNLVTDLTNVLSPLQANQIHVLFYEGSGSFGNGCVAFDTAESAAIMSKAVGAPVRLQMMRWDEHGWTHYAPAIMYDMRAGIDANGNMVAYEATGFGQGGTSIYTGRELLGSGPGSPNATANALPTQGERRRRGDGEPVAVDEGVGHELQGDQQADRLDDGHLPQRPAARPGCPADDACRRPDHGHAGGGRGDGLAGVPAAEHEHRSGRLSGGRRCSRLRRPLPAGSRGSPGSKPEQGERRHRPRDRQQPPRRRLRGRCGRRPGEQEDRARSWSRTCTGRRTPGSR